MSVEASKGQIKMCFRYFQFLPRKCMIFAIKILVYAQFKRFVYVDAFTTGPNQCDSCLFDFFVFINKKLSY